MYVKPGVKNQRSCSELLKQRKFLGRLVKTGVTLIMGLSSLLFGC